MTERVILLFDLLLSPSYCLFLFLFKIWQVPLVSESAMRMISIFRVRWKFGWSRVWLWFLCRSSSAVLRASPEAGLALPAGRLWQARCRLWGSKPGRKPSTCTNKRHSISRSIRGCRLASSSLFISGNTFTGSGPGWCFLFLWFLLAGFYGKGCFPGDYYHGWG